MKLSVAGTAAVALLCLSMATQAQKLKLQDGDLSPLKGETSIAFEFAYDHMAVGKFDTEKEYIEKKTEEYNV
jgi:hypothetical protein